MNRITRKDIRSRLAFALWGAALLAFVVAGFGLLIYQNHTLKSRAQLMMAPYAELLAVGTDAAVAFEDPRRAQEILDTLRANPHILDAEIYLEDGRLLAGFSRNPNQKARQSPPEAAGIHVGDNTVQLLQNLPQGARLHIRMGIQQLNAQTQQALWTFGAGMLVLLAVTIVQLATLSRTIVRPIAALTEAAERVRSNGDYHHRMPVADTDELSRLGHSFNAMMDAVRDREQELRHLTEMQRTILVNAAYGIISTTPDGLVTTFNPAAEQLLGYTSDEAVGKLTPMDWHDSQEIAQRASELSTELGKPIQTGFEVFAARPRLHQPEEREWTLIRKDGRRVPGLLSITALRDDSDLITGFVGLTYDLTERHKAEEQIQIAATAFEAQEGILITDANQTILRVNRAFTEITGYRAGDVIGRTPQLLASGRHDTAFYRDMWHRIATDGGWQGEIWNRRRSGELYLEWLTITAVKNAQGQVTHYVGTLVDITERKEAQEQIEHLAFYDLLTGLPNRRLFIDRLQHAMAGSVRSRQMGALLFIDLDNFKIVNDTCGHDIGDRLLIEVASRLMHCVREGDTLSRLGGDEFVAMLEDLGTNSGDAAAHARGIAQKIQDALNEPYAIAGRVHHSTPSIGATLFMGNNDSVEELLKQADIAMYQAKSAGRNTLRLFDPEMQAAVAIRAALESDLRLASELSQFLLHFQPQVNSAGRIIGAEVLLRWQHPGRGLVSPSQFIPLAEETGLILSIGQWVLDEACKVLASWANFPHTQDLQLAINVSARQFRQPNFVERVRQSLECSKVQPQRLKLELTESLVLDNVEDSIGKMVALRKIGVGFSMDDFGTGYSSLSYLTRLPLDQLKIDQSFVRNLPDNASDAVVVQSIITLARSLDLAVIAEGVETEAQRAFLDQHGCPIYQGYLFSKPVELAQFEALLTGSPGIARA